MCHKEKDVAESGLGVVGGGRGWTKRPFYMDVHAGHTMWRIISTKWTILYNSISHGTNMLGKFKTGICFGHL